MKKVLTIFVLAALLVGVLAGALMTVSADDEAGMWTAPLNDANANWLAWTPAGGSPVAVGGPGGATNVAAVFEDDGVRLSLEQHTEHNMTPMVYIPGGAEENVFVDWTQPIYFDFDTTHATLRPDHPDQNISTWFDLGFEIPGFSGHTRVRFNEWVAYAAGVPIGGPLGTAGASGRWDAFPSQGRLVSEGEYTLEEALRWTAANTDLAPEANAVINAFVANDGVLNLARAYFMIWVFGAPPTALNPDGQTGYWTTENYAYLHWFSIGQSPDQGFPPPQSPGESSVAPGESSVAPGESSVAPGESSEVTTSAAASQAASSPAAAGGNNRNPRTGDAAPLMAIAALAVASAAVVVVAKRKKG